MTPNHLPLRHRVPIDGLVPVTREEWRKKHRDSKGIHADGVRHMMGPAERGGVAPYPVVIVTED